MKDATLRSVVFDATLIDPAYPDYDVMRQIVQDALDPATDDAAGSSTPPSESAAPAGESGAPAEALAPLEDPASDVGDARAYDRARAEEALAGASPTRGG